MESAREKDNLFRQLKDKTPDMEVSMKSAVQQAELQTAKDDIARLRNELQNKDGKQGKRLSLHICYLVAAL